ncbi:hypothetical protein PFISCL1PPCAC_12934, partial [Pristionchus fissidentatus]
YPRGPRPYPIVGNLRQFNSNNLHLDIRELSHQYGPIFTLFLPVPVVVITSFEGFKEAYVTKGEFLAGRPVLAADDVYSFGDNAGIINSNGQSWVENRRLTISILRDFGMGKSLMEEQVKLSIVEFLRHLDSIEDKDKIDLRWPIHLMIANIINQTLFGFRYSFDDCKPLIEFNDAFHSVSEQLLHN